MELDLKASLRLLSAEVSAYRVSPWLIVAAFACGLLGSASLALAQEPPQLTVQRTLTFSGSAVKQLNISAVAVVGDLMVLADDELRGVLVGRRSGSDTWEFGPPLELKVGPAPSDEEFDLEGLVRTDAGIVAIGSHAATRTSADGRGRKYAKNRERQREMGPRPDRDVLLRFRLDGVNAEGRVRTTVASLRALIDADPILGAFSGVPSKENGIDIEGLTADGDVLVVGFRGPVLRHGFVPVLRVSGFPSPRADSLSFVQLGGRGIRDLVKTNDGFLLLAGPVGDSDQPEMLYWWDGRDCVPGEDVPGCVVTALGRVPRAEDGHAEGLALLHEDATGYEVLMVFDGVPGGAPSVFRVPRASF